MDVASASVRYMPSRSPRYIDEMSKYPSAEVKTRSAKPAALSSICRSSVGRPSILWGHVRGGDAPVDDQRGTGHEARVVAREEQGGLRELLGLPEASHRDVDEPAPLLLVVGQQREQQRRFDRAGAERVTPDAVARVLDGDLARHRE